MKRRAFTLVEFMVLFGILVILLSILIPYGMRLRETDRRTRCVDNLRAIYAALKNYAASNGYLYPRVVYDEVDNPNGYTAFTGIEDDNPFAANSNVHPNDVSASLWLLVRNGLLDPRVFVCPSSDDSPDLMTDANGIRVRAVQRGNFRRPNNLSYSYSSPFSNAPGYRMDDLRKGDFALMADKSPGIDPPDDDVVAPAWDAPVLERSRANSRNHRKAGQNVLHALGYVQLERTAYCGVQGDNIYTALSQTPLIDRNLPPKGNGYWGYEIGPAWEGDSYLVPTATDGLNAGVRPRRATTVPATTQTTPATAPTTVPLPPVTTQPVTQPSTEPTTQPQ